MNFMVRVGSPVDQMLLKKDIRDNKTDLTPGGADQKRSLREVGKLNRSRMSFTMKSWKNWKNDISASRFSRR